MIDYFVLCDKTPSIDEVLTRLRPLGYEIIPSTCDYWPLMLRNHRPTDERSRGREIDICYRPDPLPPDEEESPIPLTEPCALFQVSTYLGAKEYDHTLQGIVAGLIAGWWIGEIYDPQEGKYMPTRRR